MRLRGMAPLAMHRPAMRLMGVGMSPLAMHRLAQGQLALAVHAQQPQKQQQM